MELLSRTSSLRSLNISDNKLGHPIMLEFSDVLTRLLRLTWLSVASNNMDHRCIFPMLEALISANEASAHASKLEVLDISDNCVTGGKLGELWNFVGRMECMDISVAHWQSNRSATLMPIQPSKLPFSGVVCNLRVLHLLMLHWFTTLFNRNTFMFLSCLTCCAPPDVRISHHLQAVYDVSGELLQRCLPCVLCCSVSSVFWWEMCLRHRPFVQECGKHCMCFCP